MNILLLGSGGREHAMAWKMKQSPLCANLYIAPGNAGTKACGQNVAMNINDFEEIKMFCLSQNIDMLVVGPEEPLVRGIFDFVKQDIDIQHIIVVGPSMEGAKLEGSKAYSKILMREMNIPTAAYREFNTDTLEEGLAYIAQHTMPIVLKADGLAAGKGVLILDNVAEAQAEFHAMLSGKFGAASHTIVIEQFLTGIEFSVFVLTDGNDYKILPVAKDYKRIGEGDTGLNTGGMGAVSPVPFVDDVMMKKVEDRVIKPTITGLKQRNITYKGFIFFGLISVEGEPYTIEYNCRMGDPETEVVIPRLQNDLVALFASLDNGTLAQHHIVEDERTATTIFLVSGGYPGDFEKGKIMTGFDAIENSLLFYAGIKNVDNQVVTDGGRVLAITSLAENIPAALAISNRNADLITYDGKHFRKDIGLDLL
jgi:phosphoribosylamine---glycine ligase